MSENKLAFPITLKTKFGEVHQSGMTLREYYAGLAMQGILASGDDNFQLIVEASVKYADALLKELGE